MKRAKVEDQILKMLPHIGDETTPLLVYRTLHGPVSAKPPSLWELFRDIFKGPSLADVYFAVEKLEERGLIETFRVPGGPERNAQPRLIARRIL